MRKINAAIAAVFMLASSAFAANVDEQFLSQTYGDNMHAVAMGKMAGQKATSPEVKQFGQQLVDDHSRMGTELKDLAQKLNFDLSKAPSAEDMHKQHADQFEKLSGAQWDRAFMAWTIDSHNKEVEAFENQIKSGKNADIVAFAGKHLPEIRKHLQMANDLNARISKGASAEQLPADRATDVRYDERSSDVRHEQHSTINHPDYDNRPAMVERRREFVSETTNQNLEPRTYRQEQMGRDGFDRDVRYSDRSEFVSYDRDYDNGTFVSYAGDSCEPCEVKVDECDECPTNWPDIVYDNDYRALQTEYKDGDIEGAR